MTHRDWIEMPVVGSGALNDRLRAKYPIAGRAFLMYRGERVFVTMEDEVDRAAVIRFADCRPLSTTEAIELERTLPFPVPAALFAKSQRYGSGVLGLGDAIAWTLRKLGIAECSGCSRRKRALNRIVLARWWKSAQPQQGGSVKRGRAEEAHDG